MIDNTGKITGYKTTVGGADTVFPFSEIDKALLVEALSNSGLGITMQSTSEQIYAALASYFGTYTVIRVKTISALDTNSEVYIYKGITNKMDNASGYKNESLLSSFKAFNGNRYAYGNFVITYSNSPSYMYSVTISKNHYLCIGQTKGNLKTANSATSWKYNTNVDYYFIIQ